MPEHTSDKAPAASSKAIANLPGSRNGRSTPALAVFKKREHAIPIQRKIKFKDSGRELAWDEVYRDIISPKLEVLALPEIEIKMILQKYDHESIQFDNADKLMEIFQQEIAVILLEKQLGIKPTAVDGEEESDNDDDSDDEREKKDRTSSGGTGDEPVIKDLGLDSKTLYRAENLGSDEISKEKTTLYGFFSPSLAYAKDYYKGGSKKEQYNSMIKITLSKPIGNILIDLINSNDAFQQNAGDAGKLLKAKTGKKADQKLVEKKRKQQGILDKKGVLSEEYKFAKFGSDRKNTPNAVMFKQEGDVTNIEITSRVKSMTTKDGILVQHPLDPYVISIERFNPNASSSSSASTTPAAAASSSISTAPSSSSSSSSSSITSTDDLD